MKSLCTLSELLRLLDSSFSDCDRSFRVRWRTLNIILCTEKPVTKLFSHSCTQRKLLFLSPNEIKASAVHDKTKTDGLKRGEQRKMGDESESNVF